MPQTSKIERLGLEARVMELSVGRTTHEVARFISEEIQEKGIQDTVSQTTVARFLRGIREARAEETRSQVQEHIKEHVPADLNAIEEIEGWLLERFRGEVSLERFLKMVRDPDPDKIKAIAGEIATVIGGDHKTRAEFGMKAARLIELKLKYAGILENPEASGRGTSDPVDLDEFKSEMEGGERGQVSTH